MQPIKTVTWDSQDSSVAFKGKLNIQGIFDFSKALDVLISKKGNGEVVLDFKDAYPVHESFMVPAIALVREYRRRGIKFELTLPTVASGKNIFHNANWSHLIDDLEHGPSTFDGDDHLPASAYTTAEEQMAAVDRVMSMILKAVPLERKLFTALEWSVNEISDNVLNHSESPMGGVIQASTINVAGRQMVEFVVADTGIGIQQSLGETRDIIALERAIQEGVTRNSNTNQGNGLYGTFRISTLSNGRFELHSRHASLIADGQGDVRSSRILNALFPGTIVACRIACDDEKLIENALMFKGKVHQPGFDYIEKNYEAPNADNFVFQMLEQCRSFGSREAGKGARILIENLLRAEPDYSLIIDFEGVGIISSSFADEVFGRLFVALGPMAFMSRISFRHTDSSTRAILDRAISQRVSQAIAETTD